MSVAVRRSSAATSLAGRPSTASGAAPPPRLLQHERRGGGEPHPLPRRGQLVDPRQPGQEEVDGAVDVAQPHEHPQAGRHRVEALGSSWARCQARRNDATAPSTSPRSRRSSASIDRHARGSSPQVSSPATTGATSSRARAGSRRQHEPGLLAQLARLAVAAAVPRLGQPGGQLALEPSRRRRRPAPAGRGPRAPAAGGSRRRGRPPRRRRWPPRGRRRPTSGRSSMRRRPTSAATARHPGPPAPARGPGRAPGATRRSAPGCAGRSGVQ